MCLYIYCMHTCVSMWYMYISAYVYTGQKILDTLELKYRWSWADSPGSGEQIWIFWKSPNNIFIPYHLKQLTESVLQHLNMEDNTTPVLIWCFWENVSLRSYGWHEAIIPLPSFFSLHSSLFFMHFTVSTIYIQD